MIELLVNLTAEYLKTGNLLVFFIVFIGGFLVSLTPCIYPVIPLTVGYFSSHAHASKLKIFILALIYVTGVAFVYTSLGVIASLTGTLFGRISNHPYMYFAIANIFIILGLSLLGVFNFTLPNWFVPKTESAVRKKGFIGAFLFGCSSGLVLGACATPIMAVLLTYAANKHNVLWGALLLFAFAMGKSIILILVGTFSGILKYLPKADVWMVVVKKILGIILLGMGEYYLIKMGQGMF